MKKLLSILLTITILLSVISISFINTGALEYGDFIYSMYSKKSIIINGYTGESTEVVIPEEIDGFPVVIFNSDMFNGNTEITKITIPGTISRIYGHSFSGCTALETVILNEGVQVISDYAFYNCKSLKNLYLPDTLTTIGYSCFTLCESLENFHLPASVTNIDISCFSFCDLESLTVDENNPVYDSRENCNAIVRTEDNTIVHATKNTFIPSSITAIGPDAFYTTKIESIEIPDSVTQIGYSAFCDCDNLTEITLPPKLEIISDGLVQYCDNLKTVNIPDSAKEIHADAFKGCTSLENIEIPYGVICIYENVFKGCKSLKEITFPETVVSLSWYVLMDCDNLTDVTILNPKCALLTDQLIPPGVILLSMPETTTIHAHLGSYAEGYASIRKNPFVPLNPLGDVDGDMEVSVLDATKIQMFIAESAKLSKAAQNNGNVDKDAELTVLDATTIQRLLAKLITEF